MQKYTISEIERKFGYSNSKIRRLIKKKVLPITTEKRDNRDITVVLVEDEKQFRSFFGDLNYQPDSQFDEQFINRPDNQTFGKVEEAEIVKDSSDYQLMSMEQTSFDELIQSIKELADDRSQTEKEAYKKLEDQYFSLQAEHKIIREQAEKYKIESIQMQAENKIQELRIKELEEKLIKYEDQQFQINNIEQQLNSPPWWSKKL